MASNWFEFKWGDFYYIWHRNKKFFQFFDKWIVLLKEYNVQTLLLLLLLQIINIRATYWCVTAMFWGSLLGISLKLENIANFFNEVFDSKNVPFFIRAQYDNIIRNIGKRGHYQIYSDLQHLCIIYLCQNCKPSLSNVNNQQICILSFTLDKSEQQLLFIHVEKLYTILCSYCSLNGSCTVPALAALYLLLCNPP